LSFSKVADIRTYFWKSPF
jgi:hypothetical protein